MKVIAKTSAPDYCRISIATITKEDAFSLLSKNTKNRKLIPSNVQILKKTMNDGRWEFNGDTIVRDNEGNLKSGQHRLTAFVQSDRNELDIILVDLFSENDILPTLNRGKPLTTGQYLTIKGVKNANRIAAIAKCVLGINYAISTGEELSVSISRRFPDYEIEKVVNENAELIEFCATHTSRELRSFVIAVLIFTATKKPELREKFKDIIAKASDGDTPKGTWEYALAKMNESISGRGGNFVSNGVRKTMALVKIMLTTNTVPSKLYGIDLADFVKTINK